MVQLLTQMSAQMNELSRPPSPARAPEVQALFEQGSTHLAKMRELVSGAGEVGPRADEFAAEVVQLNGIIASLQETGVAPSVKRAAAGSVARLHRPGGRWRHDRPRAAGRTR